MFSRTLDHSKFIANGPFLPDSWVDWADSYHTGLGQKFIVAGQYPKHLRLAS